MNRPADLKACTCKAARLRLPSAGWRPFLPTAATHAGRQLSRLPHSAKIRTSGTSGTMSTVPLPARAPRSLHRNAIFDGLRVSPRVPRRPISQCIHYLTTDFARCRLARTHLMRPSLSNRPPSLHTAPVLRRRSMGLRSLVRTHILLAAGAALRSSWCWPRSASYATPK